MRYRIHLNLEDSPITFRGYSEELLPAYDAYSRLVDKHGKSRVSVFSPEGKDITQSFVAMRLKAEKE